ncbi:sulfurtransferase TusA family protein [Ochrobactrum pecoris]|uniref:Response regulator SirA n=1 Tax=Brucella pecoris TaxID=867683 RepID=A0A5C5CNR8_9HYPH|nr:tRNA 2-thiouridine synthesizing protein A [Brucella pecoris]NKW79346.1 sulfurtransferase TusA family protein [Brucella pecoris]TNV12787.1 response regulator SirA [Brucella pecoris]
MVEDHWELTTRQDDIPVYDLRGLKCPLPVLKTRNRLEKMPSQAFLWVEATDPLSGIDVPYFCTQEGHALVAQERRGTLQRFLIRKK